MNTDYDVLKRSDVQLATNTRVFSDSRSASFFSAFAPHPAFSSVRQTAKTPALRSHLNPTYTNVARNVASLCYHVKRKCSHPPTTSPLPFLFTLSQLSNYSPLLYYRQLLPSTPSSLIYPSSSSLPPLLHHTPPKLFFCVRFFASCSRLKLSYKGAPARKREFTGSVTVGWRGRRGSISSIISISKISILN